MPRFHNLEYLVNTIISALLIFSLFPLIILSSGGHWILVVIFVPFPLYPLAEIVFHSYTVIEVHNEWITFSQPWRKYSVWKKKANVSVVMRNNEWDSVVFHIGKNTTTFYFFNENKAVYLFSGGFSDFAYSLNRLFPNKTIVHHMKMESIHLMPELFEHYPEHILRR